MATHARVAKQGMWCSMMGWLVRPACLGVVEQIDQRLPGHNARLNRRGQLAVHSLAVSLARDTEILRKGPGPGLGSAHAHEPRRAPRRAHCRRHRGAWRIALHRDQCNRAEHRANRRFRETLARGQVWTLGRQGRNESPEYRPLSVNCSSAPAERAPEGRPADAAAVAAARANVQRGCV